MHGSVGGVSFQAELADEGAMTRRLMDFPGVDGFSIKVDPLYEVRGLLPNSTVTVAVLSD